MIKIVTVFGTGKAKPGDADYANAEQLGRLLAEAGYSIANGGYGGTMEASAKGATQAGGEATGVTCLAFGSGSTRLTTGGAANKYVSREIVTKTLDERLNKLIGLGDAYVVLAGGTGTLLELAMVWELKNKGFISGVKPIIISGEYWGALLEMIKAYEPDSGRHLLLADSPEDVVKILKSHSRVTQDLK